MSKRTESWLLQLEQVIKETLDQLDFEKIAQYMARTNWAVEDLHDGHGPDDHQRIVPDAGWLRNYVEGACHTYIVEGDCPGWSGLGFSAHLAERDGEQKLFIRFTDIRPILVIAE